MAKLTHAEVLALADRALIEQAATLLSGKNSDGTSFALDTTGGGGSGTEYTEGDTDASISGTALLWEDTSDTLRAVSVAKPLPITLPTAQITTLTPPAAITGFSTSALQGALTETPPATDTASSGQNGRLQRIAQRLTSLLALFPSSIGQKAMADSLSMTLASDQPAIPVTGTTSATQYTEGDVDATITGNAIMWEDTSNTLRAPSAAFPFPVQQGASVPQHSATATLANVAASASSVTLQASNTARVGWCFHNDSTAVVYVKCGSSASATSFSWKVPADGYFELPPSFIYDGIITGIWVTATGNARVTEFTA